MAGGHSGGLGYLDFGPDGQTLITRADHSLRWWDPATHRRLVRLQATTDQGAYLLRLTGGHWRVEAIYD